MEFSSPRLSPLCSTSVARRLLKDWSVGLCLSLLVGVSWFPLSAMVRKMMDLQLFYTVLSWIDLRLGLVLVLVARAWLYAGVRPFCPGWCGNPNALAGSVVVRWVGDMDFSLPLLLLS